MKKVLLFTTSLMCILLAVVIVNTQPEKGVTGPAVRREVAITFDDLPLNSQAGADLATQQEITNKLVGTIRANKIPVVGFVNEGKLYSNGSLLPERVALLQKWLDAGLELGNHSYSHRDLHNTPLASFEEDVVRGEAVTSELLKKKGMRLRFFRHPFLHTGRDMETKRQFEEFLSGRGYRIAPVTIDNSEWIFASAYDKASARGDKQLAQRIAEAYIPYMERKFDYFERQSTALFGYEIKQVLLLHANALNADHLEELVRMMKRRGYTFITLDEALKDTAYTSADTYTGSGGITWLHRWALSQGKKQSILKDEPVTPDFVMKEAGVAVE